MTDVEHEVQDKWLDAFGDLERFGPPHKYTARQLAGLYAVASICYHGNNRSLISDDEFDALCRWLLDNYEQCVSVGADKLDRGLLACCSGYDVGTFVKPYHDVVAMLVGHPCQCIACSQAER